MPWGTIRPELTEWSADLVRLRRTRSGPSTDVSNIASSVPELDLCCFAFDLQCGSERP